MLNRRSLYTQPSLGYVVVAVSARGGSNRAESRDLQQFPHAPHVIGDPRLHRGSHPQRLVNSAEVVKREPAGERGPVVLPFFAECVSEPCKSACAHSNGEVLALDMGRANAFGAGV